MNKKVFISFSSKDQAKADRIVNFIEKNSYNCFISSRDLIAGQEYAAQLIDNIKDSIAVVLLLSKNSNASPHVLRELEYAVSGKIPIIVYVLEEVALSKSMEYYLMTHQWVNSGNGQNERLLEGIRNIGLIDDGFNHNVTKSDITDVRKDSVRLKKSHLAFLISIIAIVCIIFTVVISLCVLKIQSSSNEDIETLLPIEKDETEAGKESKEQEVVKEIQPGQAVSFGEYLDAPIEWLVLKENDDSYTLISKYILCMKSFDAAEGGEYGIYDGVDYFSFENHIIEDPELVIKVRGNNDWSKSNLRTWLNSDRGIVDYNDQPPAAKAVYSNPYEYEEGFLSGFDDDEKNAMVAVENKTTVNRGNEEYDDEVMTTTDYVYLLSSDELEWFEALDMNVFAKPTSEAIEQDNNKDGYQLFVYDYNYVTDNYFYWLRDNDPRDYRNYVYSVGTEVYPEEQFFSQSAGGVSLGVRPVITVRKEYFSKAE